MTLLSGVLEALLTLGGLALQIYCSSVMEQYFKGRTLTLRVLTEETHLSALTRSKASLITANSAGWWSQKP